MKNIRDFLGNGDLTISEIMQKINKNTYGILFLIDSNKKLTGCITDGDIRRYLMSGGKMNDLSNKAAEHHPKYATTIEEAKALYHKKNYIVIPVINEDGMIVDLYCGDSCEIRKKVNPINMPVVINAGGKGTRLDPFTRVLPKPLIPVGDLPIIELIMQEYQLYECNDFHIIVNYKKDLIKAYFADNERHYNITWYDEEKPLGTGGGLKFLKGVFDDTFFFANCDALLKTDYENIVKFHKANNNMITMIGAYKNVSIPYGVVEMGENGIIKGMKEKPSLSFLTNTGIYVVEPGIIDDIESDEAIGFPDLIEREKILGKKVAVYPISENDWMDMGQLSELEKMRVKLYGE